jgi:methylthioribose-1-phosphate isomerase
LRCTDRDFAANPADCEFISENLGQALPHHLAHRGGSVRVIDQSRLPFEFSTVDLDTLADAAQAIRTMVVRGAPLIGATAAYGLALALRSNASDAHLDEAVQSCGLRVRQPITSPGR